MNFTFENQGTNTYLVYQVGEDEEIDSMSLGMITNNKILGLAPTVFFQQDTTKYFKYNISAKVSADQFLMGTVTKKRIIGVFSGIVNAMISAEEYMIDANSICLDLEHIYTDVSTCETILICLPVYNLEKVPVDLKTFFKNLVFSTQFDQTENCDYIAKLINYLNSASAFSLESFKELLEQIEKGTVAQLTPVSVAQPVQQAVQASVQPSPQQNVYAAPQPTQVQQAVQQSVQSVQKPVQTPVQPTPQPIPQSAAPQTGFAVPGQSSVQQQVNNETTQQTDGKEMSWLYLMQHYNKENAAIYKAQQEAKKAAKANGTSAPAKNSSNGAVPPPMPGRTPMPGQPPVSGRPPMPAPVAGQVQPKKNVNPGFAIPGQPEPEIKPATISKPISQSTPAPQPVQKPTSTVQPTPVAQPVQPTPVAQSVQTTVPPVQQPVVSPVNFGETTVLSGGPIGETTVLGASSLVTEVKPYLVRAKNNEKILLDKPVFRIGKERSYVDYFIGDNTAISRSHANIVTRDGEYFVVDTNSTNHTYLNGAMLQSNVETKITHGAKVKLANEEFEFRLY